MIDIDVDDRGKVSKSFLKDLRHQISFLEPDDDESVAALVHWIDRNIPNRADIFPSESGPWLIGVIHYLLNERNITLQELFHDKYTLRQRIVAKIDALRKAERQKAYQAFLLPECATPIVVTPALCFSFKPDEYPCNAKYQGSYKFRKHYYKEIAVLNGEEEECAIYIDQLSEVEFWVRNIERRETHSFWLQTSTDKFYPDFVCKLKDGRFLVVEYKAETSWSNEDSREKRALGELWEKRSNGACLFVMPKGRDLAGIGGKVELLG